MHGSVKTAFDKSNMKIKETLKYGFQFLHNSPARHEDYECVSGSTKNPFYYCATCWVENKLVAECMIEVWPNLIKLINFWTSLLNQSNLHVKATEMFDVVKDPFMILKLMFFSFVCGLVEPYWKVFQSDCPMAPFIYSEVKSVIKSLLSLIVKPSIIEKSKTATDSKNINLSSGGICFQSKMLKWGLG